MIGTSVKIAIRPPDAAKIVKQIRYGTAVGLTRTAQQGQAAVLSSLKHTFNLRGSWFEPRTKYGIKIKPAKPSDMPSEIRTQADWLLKQKKGGRIPGSQNVRIFHYRYAGTRYIATPSHELRPRGSKKVITKSLWPSTLRRKKGTFVIKTRRKQIPIVMSRFAPGKSGYVAMYILQPDISIKPEDTFYAPIQKVIKRRIDKIISKEIAIALAKMR